MILVPATQPVRLAENVKAKVWVRDSAGNWVKSATRQQLYEGSDVYPVGVK